MNSIGDYVRVDCKREELLGPYRMYVGKVGQIFQIWENFPDGIGVEFPKGIGWFKREQLSSEENIMYEYHRNSKRAPIGVLVATSFGGSVHFGWSLCSKDDKFDKGFGLSLAEARCSMDDGRPIVDHMPSSMFDHFETFYERAKSYFKDKVIPEYIFVNEDGEVVKEIGVAHKGKVMKNAMKGEDYIITPI